MKHSFILAALAAAISTVSAQASAYAQCGGEGYTGATTCVSGYTCTYSNDWYSQCLAGTASSVAPMTTTEKTTTKPASTVKTSSKTSVEPTTTVKASSTIKTTLKTSVKVATSTKASSTAKAATSAKAASTVTDATSTAYPSTSGTKFVVDGTTGYFAGTNAYWISFLTDDADVDLVMSHLSSAGITILRVWGFNDVTSTPSSGTVYFQSFAGSTPTINTGADGLQRLDYVVKSAEAHGIKLIINFVNNWTDYGGMAAYYTYAGITSNNDWYNNTKAQTQYQAYIKAVVSRYPTNSSIFAWELANEPRCSGCDTSIINTWATTTSKYIKSLDPNRMITIGEEGFGLTTGSDGSYPYQMSEGTDFAANLAIETIDFGAFHMYPESWDVTPTLGWGTSWIENHAKACVAVGKPCLLEEYGTEEADTHCSTESSWQATSLASAGMGGDSFWQDGDTLSTGQTSNDGYTIYYGTSDWTCLVTDHVANITAAN